MANFHKWNKIHRLGKDEVDGILNGTCVIQEKIDGANAQIWMDGKKIMCGSRTKVLDEENTLSGFWDWVQENTDKLKEFFKDNPTSRLNGEWLVRHTIPYNETAYKQFYLFDITETTIVSSNHEREYRWAQENVGIAALNYGFNYPKVFGVIKDPQLEDLEKYLGKSDLGDKGEGLVIKNLDFVNQFGDSPYAKMVTKDFMEKNAITFGGNNKYSDTYQEMRIVNKYMTLGRVKKVREKISTAEGRKLEMRDIPRIIQTSYHDLITEEAWEIAKENKVVNFKKLQSLCAKKSKQIFIDLMHEDISVADKE